MSYADSNELFWVGADVGLYSLSVVIYSDINWNHQLHGNRSSLVGNVLRNSTFRFPDLKVIIIIHSRVPATQHMP